MGTNGQLGLGDDADYEEPVEVKSKQLNNKKVLRVSSGGQHTVILSSSISSKKLNGFDSKELSWEIELLTC